MDTAGVSWLEVLAVLTAVALAAALWRALAAIRDLQHARQRLSDERERIEFVLQCTEAGTWILDLASGAFRFDERYAAMLGYTVDALPLHSLDDLQSLVHPDDWPRVQQAQLDLRRERCVLCDAEFRLRHRQGHWVWVQNRGSIKRRDATGAPTRLAGIHLDISARMRVQDELRSVNERFRLAARSGAIGVWEIDTRTGDVIWNTQMRALFAVPGDLPSDDLRRLWRERVHPDDLRATHTRLVDALQRSGHYEAEFRVCWPAGDVRHLRASGIAIQDSSGQSERMVGIMQDVTELRHKESQLVANRTFLDNAGRIAGLGAWALHADSGRLEWSAQTCRIHDLPPGHQPSLEEALSYFPEDARDRLSTALQNCITDGTPFDIELPLVSATGRSLWVRFVGEAQRVGHRTRQVVGAIQDVTEREAQRHLLTQAKEMAEATSAAKSQFLANMSHEIRTPMNAVLGMLTLLRRTPLDTRQIDYATKAESAAHSLLVIINDVLDFSKIEAGKLSLDPQPFRMQALLNNLGNILAVNLGSKPIELLFDIDPDLPPVLLGDEMRLQQVMLNLASNAVKFTQQGEVVLAIRVAAREAGAVQLAVEVRDTGIGIAPEHQEKIFSGFTQAEGSTTRRYGGTGLGLAISRRLVQLMGGDIALRSEPGQGSRFSFQIRLLLADRDEPPAAVQLVAPPAMPVQAAAQPAVDAPDAPDVAPPVVPPRVLMVDDYAPSRLLFERMARHLGWSVVLVSSGPQALQALAQADPPFDGVFVDWLMPDMDGWALCQRIHEQPPPSGKPVLVMVTARDRETLAQRSPQEQAMLDAFLVKPITSSMLQAVWDEAVRHSNGLDAQDAPPSALERLQGMRLLLAEDNLTNQQIACELLQAEGAQVVLANNGEEAVQACVEMAMGDSPPFDLVLMDLQMPVMDGLTATRQLHEQLGADCPPVVAMTANAMEADRDACLAAGMVAHVGKPFHLDDLVGLLRRLTGREPRAGGGLHRSPIGLPAQSAMALPPPPPRAEGLPVLDQSGAIARMGGNAMVYQRMLQQLALELPAFKQRLQQLAAAVDAAGADESAMADAQKMLAREWHTLKGLAGTMGAQALASTAARAEAASKAAARLAGGKAVTSPAAAQAVEAALDALIARVQQCVPAPPSIAPDGGAPSPLTPASPVAADDSRPAVVDLVTRLRDKLRIYDMQAMDVMFELERKYPAAMGSTLPILAQAVQTLDFSRALDVCDQWLQEQTP